MSIYSKIRCLGAGTLLFTALYRNAMDLLRKCAAGGMAGLAIGGTVWFEALFAGTLCGASMNPARSLSPAAPSGEWSHFSAYVLGPVVSALAGAFFYEFIRCHPREDREVKGCC